MSLLLPYSLLALALLTASAPWLSGRLGRRAGAVLASGMAAVAVLLAPALVSTVGGGTVTFRRAWLPEVGIELALHLDALSALFALVVLVVGVLVLAYTSRYLGPDEAGGWLLTLLTAFGTAMLGLVLAADVLLLFVFWEATTIVSFLLIGGPRGRGRPQALRAAVITGGGGLALLAGLVLLAQVAGTADLTALTAGDPDLPAGTGAAVALLIAGAAFTKSAQVPFHLWLPGAMVAPTPVSTYLHAATMVKAGIYVMLRFSPVFAGEAVWGRTLLWAGLVTAVLGGVAALRAVDLKSLLAGSTVSQLGLLTALIGVGTHAALLAAVVHTLAHAAFKSSLFMAVGAIDHATGTRRLDELSGLARTLPGVAVTMVLAGLSMAGVMPLLGFISKEQALTAFVEVEEGRLALVVLVVASILTVAYTTKMLTVLVGAPRPARVLHRDAGLVVSPAVVAVVGLVLGLQVKWSDPLMVAAAGVAAGGHVSDHLALWHGLNTPFLLSMLALVLGVALGVVARRWHPGRELAADAFDTGYAGLLRGGGRWGDRVGPLMPLPHLATVVGTVLLVGLAASRLTPDVLGASLASSLPEEWVVMALTAAAVVGVVLTLRRLAAVALIGAVGFLLTVWYVLAGAPDLALTQLLIETLIVVLIVLVFRRLPARFPASSPRRTWLSAGLAVAGGLGAGVATWALSGRRPLSPAGRYYLENAYEETGGRNVVNTILVDYRGFDTLGEVTVLAVAALGAWALVHQVRGRRGAGEEDGR